MVPREREKNRTEEKETKRTGKKEKSGGGEGRGGEKGRKGDISGSSSARDSSIELCRAHDQHVALHVRVILYFLCRAGRRYYDALLLTLSRGRQTGPGGGREKSEIIEIVVPKIKGVQRGVCSVRRMDDVHPKRQLLSPS